MDELKLRVEEFIDKHNKLEEKIDAILYKYNELETNYNLRSIYNIDNTHNCSCVDYMPFIVNGPCRFCYLEKF